MPSPMDPEIDLSHLLEPLPPPPDGPATARRAARRRRQLRAVTGATTLLVGISAIALLAARGGGDGSRNVHVASQPASELVRNAPQATLGAGTARVWLQQSMSTVAGTGSGAGAGAGPAPMSPREGAIDFDAERGWLKGEGPSIPGLAVSGTETRYLGDVIYERGPSFAAISGSGGATVHIGGAGVGSAGVASGTDVPPPDVASMITGSPQHVTVEISPMPTVLSSGTTAPPTPPPGPVPVPAGSAELRELVATINEAGVASVSGASTPGKPWMKYDLKRLEAGADGAAVFGVAAAADGGFPSKQLRFLESIGDDVQSLGNEQVRGVDTRHFEGDVDLDRLAGDAPWPGAPIPEMMGLRTTKVGVWLDADGRVRRMTTSMQMPTHPGDPSQPIVQYTSTIELYDFGTEVQVEAPPDIEVSDMLDVIRNRPTMPPPALPSPPPPPPTTVKAAN